MTRATLRAHGECQDAAPSRKEPRREVALAPADVRACTGTPAFYVTEAGAAELSGVHAADPGVNAAARAPRAARPTPTPAACPLRPLRPDGADYITPNTRVPRFEDEGHSDASGLTHRATSMSTRASFAASTACKADASATSASRTHVNWVAPPFAART